MGVGAAGCPTHGVNDDAGNRDAQLVVRCRGTGEQLRRRRRRHARRDADPLKAAADAARQGRGRSGCGRRGARRWPARVDVPADATPRTRQRRRQQRQHQRARRRRHRRRRQRCWRRWWQPFQPCGGARAVAWPGRRRGAHGRSRSRCRLPRRHQGQQRGRAPGRKARATVAPVRASGGGGRSADCSLGSIWLGRSADCSTWKRGGSTAQAMRLAHVRLAFPVHVGDPIRCPPEVLLEDLMRQVGILSIVCLT
mmetsp:Transcript_38741/g.115180  ORF Transcript_38741/g.115180 Transcript_38741/m.115180 type:complete len:253 (-) Transcript_38741:1101-1859(-)